MPTEIDDPAAEPPDHIRVVVRKATHVDPKREIIIVIRDLDGESEFKVLLRPAPYVDPKREKESRPGAKNPIEECVRALLTIATLTAVLLLLAQLISGLIHHDMEISVFDIVGVVALAPLYSILEKMLKNYFD